MPARKRGIDEVAAEVEPALAVQPPVPPLLVKLRNMWEFACLMQYISLFGDAVKISDEVDVDLLEMECCRPDSSDLLPQIGLALLKNVSSHRGLTPELFDEYTRRQYMAKAPHRNPFGEDETPNKFTDFDVLQKIRILHQLSVWTLFNPDRIRQYYADEVPDHTIWRVEEFGWDRHDRSYFVLDDNRLYRITKPKVKDPPKPNPKARAKTMKKKVKGSRSSKRQKLANGAASDSDAEEDLPDIQETSPVETLDNGLGGAKWECVAITLEDYNAFLDTLRKSKDADEKNLLKRTTEQVLPELERHAAARERKEAQRRRELLNLEKMATAKRSSRIADRQEQLNRQAEAEAQERRKKEDLAMALREQERQRKLEEARESRMITREQRLKDREVKRILHEEELNRLEAQSHREDTSEGRISERQRKTEMAKRKQELEKFSAEEDDWYFDCAICGVHGKNLDDGSHSLACEKCNVWQHSSCHGIREEAAEREDFHFLCRSCANPRPIKIKVSSTNNSPKQDKQPNGLHGHNPINTSSASKADPASQPTSNYPPKFHWSTVQSPNSYSDPQVNGDRLPAIRPHQSPLSYAPPSVSVNGHASPKALSSSPYPPSHSNGTTRDHFVPHGIQTSHQYNGHLTSPQAHHNPFHNDLGRQRPLSASSHTAPLPRSPQNYNGHSTQTQQSSFATPYSYARHGSTPQSSGAAPHISASPTPSLAATQGNTSMIFSPASQPSAQFSYVPKNNQPALAAMSPTKQASPPPLPMARDQVLKTNAQIGSGVAGVTLPALQSSSPNNGDRLAGISPVKHDLSAPSPPRLPSIHVPAPENPETSARHLGSPPWLNSRFGGEGDIGGPVNSALKKPMTSAAPDARSAAAGEASADSKTSTATIAATLQATIQ